MDEAERGVDWAPPWEHILEWIEDEVGRAVRRYRLPAEERDELRQQIATRIVGALRRFDPTSEVATLETWVRRQAGWGVADYWRGRYRRGAREVDEVPVEPVAEQPPPDQRTIDLELRAALERCLAKLTAGQRERFLLADDARGTSTTQSEIARRLGISRDTLKDAVARARVLLRRCLHRAGFSPARGSHLPPGGPSDTVTPAQ